MKYLISICVLFFMMISCSCQEQARKADATGGEMSKECIFLPAKIKFNQLTEFTQNWQITAYIDMLDQFSLRIKAASIWKFELYEYVPRSAESKGARLYFWPDINLADAKVNSGYWQDYLRCYKFELNLESELTGGNTYILQAECITPDGKRITDSIELKL